jgi:hypothetical protein
MATETSDPRSIVQHTIANPRHPVPDYVASAFRALHEEKMASWARQHEEAKVRRPSREERQAKQALYRSIAKGLGAERELEQMLGGRRASFSKLRDHAPDAPQRVAKRVPVDLQPPMPARAFPEFWYASRDIWGPNFYGIEQGVDGGMHYSGRFTYDDGDLLAFNFGITAAYGIDWGRLPVSPTGRFNSVPHCELLGGFTGYTSTGDIFEGDCWCKVWLILNQRVVQFSGGQVIVLAENTFVTNLLDEENEHRDRIVELPGAQSMPPVFNFAPAISDTIWSHLHVRFDVQLEGNSFLWLDRPDINIRLFQWPIQPA